MKSARARTTLTLGVFLLANFSLFAQNGRIDSLKEKLSTQNKAESFVTTFELAREYLDDDNLMSLEFARKAYSIATLTKDNLGVVKSLRLIGQAQRRLNNLDSSIYYFKKCLPLAKSLDNYEEIHNVLNGIGIALSFQAKYDEALHYQLQGLDLASAKNDSIRIDRSLFNLGLVYYKLMNYQLALDYYNKSLQMKVAINEQYDLDLLKVNISLCYAFLGKTDEARKTLMPVLDIYATNLDETPLIFIHYASGVIWFKASNLIMAESDFLHSYSIAKKKGDTRYIFDNIIYLSKIYIEKGNQKAAEEFLTEGEQMAKVNQFDLEKIKLYEEFNALYTAKREYKKLSHYREKYIQLKESVFNEKHTNNLMRLHAEASEKENKARLALQDQEVRLKQEIITKQQGINILISLAVILLTVITYLLFRIVRDRKMTNTKLNKRIVERTSELEDNFKNLTLAIKQRDITLDRISNNVNNSLQSMRGQCSSGIEGEVNPDSLKYFKEIETTAARLEKSLKNILTESIHSLSSTI